MSGWLVLTHADDTYEKYETPGETFIEVAVLGYPLKRSFTTEGVISAEWFAEEPTVKGQSVAEKQMEEEAKQAKAAEKAAEPATVSSSKK